MIGVSDFHFLIFGKLISCKYTGCKFWTKGKRQQYM